MDVEMAIRALKRQIAYHSRKVVEEQGYINMIRKSYPHLSDAQVGPFIETSEGLIEHHSDMYTGLMNAQTIVEGMNNGND